MEIEFKKYVEKGKATTKLPYYEKLFDNVAKSMQSELTLLESDPNKKEMIGITGELHKVTPTEIFEKMFNSEFWEEAAKQYGTKHPMKNHEEVDQ